MHLYMVKRGPRPSYYHRDTPHHRVIICTRKDTARWEAGSTDKGAYVWEQFQSGPHFGWTLMRWNGFDVDYGNVVHSMKAPDGTDLSIHHRHAHPETWELLRNAVWWDWKKMPQWLADEGVVYPSDAFTQRSILDDYGYFSMRDIRRSPYDPPAFWPVSQNSTDGTTI